jgi:DNA-binding CsgD family transcriptional regulator
MAATDPQKFRAHVFDLLHGSIGFDKASMLVFHARLGLDMYARGYDRPEVLAEVPRFMDEFEPWELAAATAGKPIVDVEMLPAWRRDQLSLYQRFLFPERVSVFTTVTWRPHQAVIGLSLGRTGRGARFIRREIEKFEALLPAIQLGDALVTLRQRDAASFDAWAREMGLSAREREVAALVVRGLSNREIAALLRTSANTVHNQLASVFRKADVSTRAELVFLATTFTPARRGLEPPRWLAHLR